MLQKKTEHTTAGALSHEVCRWGRGRSAGGNEKERNTKEKEQKEKAGARTPVHSRAPCATALLAPVTRFPHCWAAHPQHGVDAHSLGGGKSASQNHLKGTMGVTCTYIEPRNGLC